MIFAHNRWIVAIGVVGLLFFAVLGGAAGLYLDKLQGEYRIELPDYVGIWLFATLMGFGTLAGIGSLIYPWESGRGKGFVLALVLCLSTMAYFSMLNGSAFIRMHHFTTVSGGEE